MAERTRGEVGVVLAAGRGERFGDRTKQVEEVRGRPLVAHAVATALAAGMGRVVVVVGHDADVVARAAVAAAPPDRVVIVTNPRHAEGQSTSFVAGIRAALADEAARVAVLLLADQPGIAPEAVRAVADAVHAGAVAARARYDDGPGHPTAFGRPCWTTLLEATGDAGARQFLADLDVVSVAVAGTVPADVDTPADLDELRADGPK